MPKTIIKIKTWRCSCGYSQDFEPTQANMNKYFNNDMQYKGSNLEANQCPSCVLKGVVGTLNLETDNSKKTTVTIMGEDELDTHEVPDGKDAEGKDKKRKLTAQEKEEYRSKIQADTAKYQALAD